MIVKSTVRGGFKELAKYLQELKPGKDQASILLSTSTGIGIDETFEAMWNVAADSRCKKPLHHIALRPMKGERITDDQYRRMAADTMREFGYPEAAHEFALVKHIDMHGDTHIHLVVCRVNTETGKAMKLYKDRMTSMRIARQIEQKYGLRTLKKLRRQVIKDRERQLKRAGRMDGAGAAEWARRAGRIAGGETQFRKRLWNMKPAESAERNPSFAEIRLVRDTNAAERPIPMPNRRPLGARRYEALANRIPAPAYASRIPNIDADPEIQQLQGQLEELSRDGSKTNEQRQSIRAKILRQIDMVQAGVTERRKLAAAHVEAERERCRRRGTAGETDHVRPCELTTVRPS